jgi:HemY protein
MRFGLYCLAALALGAFAAHFVLQDRGYVLISFRSYVVEMSVPALVLVLVVAYASVRIASRIWRAPRALGHAVADRRLRRAGARLTTGLIHMTEGDFGRGERVLTQGLKGAEAPLVNYLMAARAAQAQGSVERRNEWLTIAFDELPEAETAILLTQAELQFEAGEHERPEE